MKALKNVKPKRFGCVWYGFQKSEGVKMEKKGIPWIEFYFIYLSDINEMLA